MHFLRLRLLLLLVIGTDAVYAAKPAQPAFYSRRDYNTYDCNPAVFGVLTIADLNGDGIPDVVCGAVQLGVGNGTFRQGPKLPIANEQSDFIAADVNGDGKLDIVFSNFVDPLWGIGVMLGNGNGSFQNPINYLSNSFIGVEVGFGETLAEGDFNGDGIPDFAEVGAAGLDIFLGIKGGGFNIETPITLPYSGSDYSIAVSVVDMNGDGRLDLIVDATDAIYVLLGNGDGTFQAPILTTTAANAGYGAMAVGDINGDGSPDVVLVNIFSSDVLVYPGMGNGEFASPKTVDLPGGTNVVIADLNGDGTPDLVNAGVEIAFGRGHWEFEPPIFYEVNEDELDGSPAVGVADLRNNGRMDVLGGSVALSVLLNGGKGKLENGIQTAVSGGYIACTATGDFNGDGIPDLAISNNAAIEIYLGTGRATAPYKAGATYTVAGADCPVAGDLNKDGILDLLVPTGGIGSAGFVIGFLGNGDGTFRQGPSSAISSVGYFALADFNGDGILDYASTTNLLALGNGDGSFGQAQPFEPGGDVGAFAIAAADLNGDGKADIVLTNFVGESIYVLLSNGAGGFQETTMGSTGLPGYIALGDVNGDGITDMVIAEGVGAGVYLNNGSGGFGTPIALNDPLSDGGNAVIADLNGDAIVDIAFEGTASAAVFLGEGSATFAAPFYLGTANDPSQLFALNAHGQNPNAGTPDLVEMDATGVIWTLLNETK